MAAVAQPPIDIPDIPEVASDDDEESFVVLTSSSPDSCEFGISHDILPPIEGDATIDAMQSLNKREISLLENAATSIHPQIPQNLHLVSPQSPDSSFGDVPKQIDQLMKENQELKNIVQTNNESMKYQMEQINKWKEGVEATFETYRNKLREAKAHIEKAREDNEKLLVDVEKYKKIKELQDEEIINLKRRPIDVENLKNIADKSQQNLKDFDAIVAKQKIAELEGKLIDSKKDNDTSLAKLAKLQAFMEKHNNDQEEFFKMQAGIQKEVDQINGLEYTIKELSASCDKLRVENEELKRKNVEDTKSSEGLIAKLAETEELLMDYMKEKEQIIKIRNSKEEELLKIKKTFPNNNYATSLLKLVFESFIEEQSIQDLKTLLNCSQESVNLKQKCDKLIAENDSLMERLDNQIEETKRYQGLIHLKEDQVEQISKDLAHVKLSNQQLLEQQQIYNNVKVQSDSSIIEEQLQQVRQQLMNSQMSITALEQSVATKDKELIETRNLLQQCNINKDDQFALKEQLSLYKTDFEAEKESRKAIKREKDQIEEDLQNLHRRNQQLQEEIDLLRDRGFVMCPTPRETANNEASVHMDYECPKCHFKFKDYNTLENHVFRCLELEGFP